MSIDLMDDPRFREDWAQLQRAMAGTTAHFLRQAAQDGRGDEEVKRLIDQGYQLGMTLMCFPVVLHRGVEHHVMHSKATLGAPWQGSDIITPEGMPGTFNRYVFLYATSKGDAEPVVKDITFHAKKRLAIAKAEKLHSKLLARTGAVEL